MTATAVCVFIGKDGESWWSFQKGMRDWQAERGRQNRTEYMTQGESWNEERGQEEREQERENYATKASGRG